MNHYLEPDPNHSALITIDVQRDTLDGQPLEIAGTSEALPRMRALIDLFRNLKRPIYHIVRIYRRDGSNVDLCRKNQFDEGRPILVEKSLGAELARELFTTDTVRYDTDLLLSGKRQSVGDNEYILYKPRWGAFYQTELEANLRAEGINTLVFCGCNFPNCPRTSIYEASERDFRIVVASDAISGLYEKGTKELVSIGALVEPHDEIRKRFS